MLEIIEIIKPARQGMTMPFLCNASNRHAYYVKGYAATIPGLMKEWLGSHLALAFGLPVPEFSLAFLDPDLVNYWGDMAVYQLKGGYVFASKQVPSVTELKYETVNEIDAQLKLSILLFDLWVENEDRTLSEKGGNPNLLWKSDESDLYVIDHNLIFDEDFNKKEFWDTHVFKNTPISKQVDFIERQALEERMKKALACWQSAWDKIPEEWIEFNNDTQGFDPEKHLQRLKKEANGDIWLKLS